MVNSEVKRFQELAGIYNESEDTDIEKAMAAGLSSLKDTSSIDEIEDEDQPAPLNESVTALVISSLLAAPKVISWIGKAINFIAKPFVGKEENEVGQKVKHFAHKWEGLYIKAITGLIKLTKFAKSLWMRDDGKVDEQKLITVAKILYAVILAVALGQALGTVLSPGSAVMKAIEGSLGSIKAAEIAQIASKIKGQL